MLLAIIAALLTGLGTASLRTLEDIRDQVISQGARIRANEQCCTEVRTRLNYSRGPSRPWAGGGPP